MKAKLLFSAIMTCLAILPMQSVNAHIVGVAWLDNLDGSITFTGGSWNGTSNDTLGGSTGLVINGTTFSWETSSVAITDAAWDLFRVTQNGWFDWNGGTVSGSQTLTLDQAELATASITAGTNPMTVNGTSNSWWAPTGPDANVSISYTPTAVPEPTILALLSLGIFGLGLNKRKKLT